MAPKKKKDLRKLSKKFVMKVQKKKKEELKTLSQQIRDRLDEMEKEKWYPKVF